MQDSLTFGAATHVGLVRVKNEDSHAVLQPSDGHPGALVIADGMGGHRRGELASRVAVDYVCQQLNGLTCTEPVKLEQIAETLGRIIEKANVKVYLSSLSEDENQGMGTTLTVAIFLPGHVCLGHIGDCRAYLLHGGDLVQLTVDHTLVQELVDAGEISAEASRQHPNRNVLTRALGVPDYLQPDISEHALASGDRLLLCSDGLHGLVEEHEIRSQMRQAQPPGQLAESLVGLALPLGGEDNITVLTAFA